MTLLFETATLFPSAPLHHLQHDWCKLHTVSGIVCFITMPMVCVCHCCKPAGLLVFLSRKCFLWVIHKGLPFQGRNGKGRDPVRVGKRQKKAKEQQGGEEWTWMWPCVTPLHKYALTFFHFKFTVSISRPASLERFCVFVWLLWINFKSFHSWMKEFRLSCQQLFLFIAAHTWQREQINQTANR